MGGGSGRGAGVVGWGGGSGGGGGGGGRVTVVGAYCAIMELKRKCRLPFTAIVMVLQLLQLLCPLGNKLPTTKHQLMSFFRRYPVSYSRQNFCCTCISPIQSHVRRCNKECTKQEPNSIIEIPPDTALQQIMSGKFKFISISEIVGTSIIIQSRR